MSVADPPDTERPGASHAAAHPRAAAPTTATTVRAYNSIEIPVFLSHLTPYCAYCVAVGPSGWERAGYGLRALL